MKLNYRSVLSMSTSVSAEVFFFLNNVQYNVHNETFKILKWCLESFAVALTNRCKLKQLDVDLLFWYSLVFLYLHYLVFQPGVIHSGA